MPVCHPFWLERTARTNQTEQWVALFVPMTQLLPAIYVYCIVLYCMLVYMMMSPAIMHFVD